MLPMKWLVVIGVLSVSLPAAAQEKEHPIDVKCEKCLAVDSNYTTRNMVECVAIALNKWQAEMDRYYQLLIDTLDIEMKNKLKTTQQEWIIYKDMEIQFMATLYDKMAGTMWLVTTVDRQRELFRQRAVALKGYYANWKFK